MSEFQDIRNTLPKIKNPRVAKLYKQFSTLYSSLVVTQYLKFGEPQLEEIKDKELKIRENLKCIDKNMYSGQVDLKNRRHGLGVMLCADKSLYIGYFKLSFQKGQGRYFASNGVVYDGKWNGSMLKESGFIYYMDGQIYEGCLSYNIPQGLGKLNLPGKWEYTGSFLEGLKHGKGYLVKENGEIYTGDFFRDKMEGKGVISFSNKNKYEGEVKKGKMHGKGKLSTKDYEYEGDFADGFEDGFGKVTYTSGKVYEGFFRNGRPDGKGVETRNDGLVIEGLWKAGFMIECFNDAYEDPLDAYPAFNKVELAENFKELGDKVQASRSAKMKSHLEEDKETIDIYGEIETDNLVEYDPLCEDLEETDIEQQLRVLSDIVISHSLYVKSVQVFKKLPLFDFTDNTSQAELSKSSNENLKYFKKNLKFKNEWVSINKKEGVIYKGERDAKGMFHGRGLMLSKGSIYQGFFRKNLKDGHGREILPTGSYYEGGWVFNKKSGFGIERTMSGKEYIGEWEKNAKHGWGVFTCPSWRYEGVWVNDKKQGEGECFFADGTKYKGEFFDDTPNGYGCFIEINGKATVGVWSDGKLVPVKGQENVKYVEKTVDLSESYSIPIEITAKNITLSFPQSSLAPNEFSVNDVNILQDLEDG